MRKLGRGRLPARYRYTEKLQPEDWAWEFLRRDPEYRSAATGDRTGRDRAPDATAWGLHFRGRPRPPRP